MRQVSRFLQAGLVGVAVLGFAFGAQAQPAPTLLDHYLCYKGALSKGEVKLPTNPRQIVGLVDQFESRAYDVKDPIWHCNPVAKTYNNATTTVNFPAIHLRGYPILLTKIPAPNTQLPDVKPSLTTLDQFGVLRLKVLKPESLNMRASKTEVATPPYVACAPSKPCVSGTCVPATGGFCLSTDQFPAPPANDGSVDNFKCYAVALNKWKFTKLTNQVGLNDQFSVGGYPQWNFDVVKPTRVCTPVNKALENPGAETHPSHLVCYKVVNTKPPFPPKDHFPGRKVADSNDNFVNQRLDVKTVNELCIPASKRVCGDGVVDPPYEECDAPKICDANSGANAGKPCTKLADCSPGKCIPNKVQCPGGAVCAPNCTCPLGNPVKPATTFCHDYHEAGSFLDICESLFGGGCAPPATVPLLPTDQAGTTFTLCTTAADTKGMRALTVDPASWFSDALYTEPPASPIPVTITLCSSSTMTGVLFTKANAVTKAPNKFCVIGDPATLRAICTNDSDCDGPTPTTGNGVCANRDVDYTSNTDLSGPGGTSKTEFFYGDGTPDAAGSALFAQDLDIHVWIGSDTSCAGTGADPTCVGCDGMTPAPAGRIGVSTLAGPPDLTLPLITRFTTGHAENTITSGSQNGALDGREVQGNGAPGLTSQLVVAGGNAQLKIDTSPQPFGFVDVQFFAKQVFGPFYP
jgi:hypothetical protein